ncbi:response regulator [bacterium]|nr:response regulator [bacterium]
MSGKKRILIVEDELDFAKMIKLRLESVGYEVMIAGDTYDGTQKVLKEHPDLLILDLMMPAGGGFTLLERIKQHPITITMPVIILTGKTIDDEVRQKADKYGVAAIFLKPYKSERFVEKIKSLLPT